jgi:hypothetical protein
MRRLPLFVLLCVAGAIPAAASAQGFDPKLEETVRCYDAASVYAQFYVVSGKKDAALKMLGYASELKGRAYALGAKDGKSHAAVKAEFADNDPDYVRRFYSFAKRSMAIADFGNGEIADCNLDKALK